LNEFSLRVEIKLFDKSNVSRSGWARNTFGLMPQMFSELSTSDIWLEELRLFKT
jgi:hypothetical protein